MAPTCTSTIPVADAAEAVHEYGVELTSWEKLPRGHAVVVAVAHREFNARPIDDYLAKLETGGLYVDVKCQVDARCAARAGRDGVASLMTPFRVRTRPSAPRRIGCDPGRGAGWSPAAPASSVRICCRRCSSSTSTSSASTISRPATGATSTKSERAVAPAAWRRHRVHRRRHRATRDVPAGVRRRRHRAASGRARIGAALDRGSAAHARRQRDRLPQHAGRRTRCRRQPLRLRGVELDLWRSPGLAEGRGRDRAAAVALRGHQARRTSSMPTCSRAATEWRRSGCAISTCSARGRIPTARTPR